MKLLVMHPKALFAILERVAAGEDAETIMFEVLDIASENQINTEEE